MMEKKIISDGKLLVCVEQLKRLEGNVLITVISIKAQRKKSLSEFQHKNNKIINQTKQRSNTR